MSDQQGRHQITQIGGSGPGAEELDESGDGNKMHTRQDSNSRPKLAHIFLLEFGQKV